MLSPLKIIVLIAIIAAVWYGFQRFGKSGGGKGRVKGKDDQKSAAERRAEQIEDMVKCRYCDTYIPAGEGDICGRPDCPGTKAAP